MQTKYHTAAFLVAMSLSLVAQAKTDERPFVTKSSASGYAPAEWTRFEKCEIYADRVVITRTFGLGTAASFSTTQTLPIQFSGDRAAITAEIELEAIRSEDNFLCDGPSTVVTVARATSGEEPWLLYSSGGCGQPRQTREGAVANALTMLADSYCVATH